MSHERTAEAPFAARDLAVALCVGWLAFEGLAVMVTLLWFRAPLVVVTGHVVHELVRVALDSVSIISAGGVS